MITFTDKKKCFTILLLEQSLCDLIDFDWKLQVQTQQSQLQFVLIIYNL